MKPRQIVGLFVLGIPVVTAIAWGLIWDWRCVVFVVGGVAVILGWACLVAWLLAGESEATDAAPPE